MHQGFTIFRAPTEELYSFYTVYSRIRKNSSTFFELLRPLTIIPTKLMSKHHSIYIFLTFMYKLEALKHSSARIRHITSISQTAISIFVGFTHCQHNDVSYTCYGSELASFTCYISFRLCTRETLSDNYCLNNDQFTYNCMHNMLL